MPKVSRVGKFRKTALASSTVDKKESSDSAGKSKGLSRGQRKRQAKRDQYLQRQRLVLSTLKLQRQEEQKRRIDGFDALRKALVESASSKVSGQPTDSDTATSYGTNKSKKGMVGHAVTHLGLVMEHPSFLDNPFATIQEHLKNTLKETSSQLEEQSKLRTQEDETKLEVRKQAKKEKREASVRKQKGKFRASRRTNAR